LTNANVLFPPSDGIVRVLAVFVVYVIVALFGCVPVIRSPEVKLPPI
jgi:hypothetical protein